MKLTHFVPVLALPLATVSAQMTSSPSPAATPSPPKPACTAPEHRQFDFWIGSWTVRSPDGTKTAGTSKISRASEGCAILEQWKGARGNPGMSINYYDPSTKHWHQVWVGGDGTILKLEGEFKNGAMVLEGETDDPKVGTPVKNRITWTPMSDYKVKQEWATSQDGKEWKTIFVGIYSHE